MSTLNARSIARTVRRLAVESIRNHTPIQAQKRQDLWVISIFRAKRRGTFVDLAAADGRRHSNTLALERLLGWSGLLVEPNPLFAAQCRMNRSATVAQCAVSNFDEQVEFRFDNGQLGGIVAEDADNNLTNRGDQLPGADVQLVQARPLGSLLDEHGLPQIIDYLSLDIEGAEERALVNFPFDRYRFNAITIERPSPLLNRVLFEHGYLFVKNFRFDTFYVHRDFERAGAIRRESFAQVGRKEW